MLNIYKKDYESVGEVYSYCKAMACKYTVGSRAYYRVNISTFCRSHLLVLSSGVGVTVIYRHVRALL